jgi:hypothetical protein
MHNTLPNLGALVVFFKEGQQSMLLNESNVTTKSIGKVVVPRSMLPIEHNIEKKMHVKRLSLDNTTSVPFFSFPK